eukprot:gene24257-biopygen17905
MQFGAAAFCCILLHLAASCCIQLQVCCILLQLAATCSAIHKHAQFYTVRLLHLAASCSILLRSCASVLHLAATCCNLLCYSAAFRSSACNMFCRQLTSQHIPAFCCIFLHLAASCCILLQACCILLQLAATCSVIHEHVPLNIVILLHLAASYSILQHSFPSVLHLAATCCNLPQLAVIQQPSAAAHKRYPAERKRRHIFLHLAASCCILLHLVASCGILLHLAAYFCIFAAPCCSLLQMWLLFVACDCVLLRSPLLLWLILLLCWCFHCCCCCCRPQGTCSMFQQTSFNHTRQGGP